MGRLESTGLNAPQIDYWNGPAGDKWANFADSLDVMTEDLGSAAMDACDIRLGHALDGQDFVSRVFPGANGHLPGGNPKDLCQEASQFLVGLSFFWRRFHANFQIVLAPPLYFVA